MSNCCPGQMVFPQATRKTDPDTSRIAEQRIIESGTAQAHCEIILAALCRYNGSTTAELAEHTPLTEEQVHKRMSGLADGPIKCIKRGKERKCKVKGSLCLTWWIL